MRTKFKKIVVIVGPTASGKTVLAIKLAKQFDGEVISADSRQVYRDLNIGTNKLTTAEMEGISHHVIDIADPNKTYTVADFVRDADRAIADIVLREKLPIVAGGTFFYVDALLGNKTLVKADRDETLRTELEKFSTEVLYKKLVATDPRYAERIDRHNPRRIVRALEIIGARGSMPIVVRRQRYDACIIGVDVHPEILRERIDTRLDKTLKRGLVGETRNLLAQGISEPRLDEIGLQYRVVLAHLRDEYTYEEMRTLLERKVWQYARRQYTWLRKMEGVQWYAPADTIAIEAAVRQFLL